MKKERPESGRQVLENEWLPFSGGGLEARRPQVLCAACAAKRSGMPRARIRFRATQPQSEPLCFQCFRAGLERDGRLRSARDLDTASVARFGHLLPFEPVNRERLERLRTERVEARGAMATGPARIEHARRQAQIAARRALGEMTGPHPDLRLAGLQFPESWLPFVVAR